MSFILLGILNSQVSGLAISHWFAYLAGAGSERRSKGSVDADGNIYQTGDTTSYGAGGRDFSLVKLDAEGVIQWQRVLGDADNQTAGDVITNGTDVYMIGQTPGSPDPMFVAKYNSSGVIQWQRALTFSNDAPAFGVGVDGSGNVYIAGRVQDTPFGAILTKYNSSGTFQWTRQLSSSGNDVFDSVSVDSSGNSYVSGLTFVGGTSSTIIAKYDTSGNIQWQRTVTQGSNSHIAIDSSGNSYIGSRVFSPSSSATLVKVNSSGSVQFKKSYGTGGENFLDVAVGDDSSIYAISGGGSPGIGRIVKFDASGNIVWQRGITGATTSTAKGIAVDANGTVYAFLRVAGIDATLSLFIAKLPNDGSLTGAYTLNGFTVNYTTESLASGDIVLSDATGTMTGSTPSVTSAASSLTDAASSFTIELVNI